MKIQKIKTVCLLEMLTAVLFTIGRHLFNKNANQSIVNKDNLMIIQLVTIFINL